MDQGDTQKKRTRRAGVKHKAKGGGGAAAGPSAAEGDLGGGQEPKSKNQTRNRGRSAPKIITVPITTTTTTGPKKNFAKLEDLAAAAANTSLPLAQRLSSLNQLEKVLSTSAGQVKGSRFFDGIAPPLLQILCSSSDSSTELSTAAVATITTWITPPVDSTTSGGSATTTNVAGSSKSADTAAEHPGSLILGLLLPILEARKYPPQQQISTSMASPSGSTSTWTSLEPHQLASVLILCRECLSKIPGLAAFKRAPAVFTAARAIVDAIPASSTSGGGSIGTAIGPAFELLVQAMKVHHVPSTISLSLGDAVLEWARREDLPGSSRPVLVRAMHAVGAAWSAAGNNNVVHLLEEILKISSSVPSAGIGCDVSSVQIMLNLTACAVPLVVRVLSLRGSEAAAKQQQEQVSKSIESMVVQLVNAFDHLVEESEKVTAEEVREMCRYVHSIVSAALRPPATPSTAAATEQQQAPRPSLLVRPAEEKETLDSPSASSFDGIEKPSSKTNASGDSNDEYVLITAATRLYTSALQRQDVIQHPELSSMLTKDLLSWITQLPRDISFPKSIHDALLQLAMPPEGPLSVLRSSATPAVVQPVALLYVQLLTRLPQLLCAILDEINTSFSGLYSTSDSGGGDAGEGITKLAFDVNVLLAATKAGFSTRAFWKPIWPVVADVLVQYSTTETSTSNSVVGLVLKLVQIAQLALSSQEEEKESEENQEVWCRALYLASQLMQSTPKLTAQMLHWQLQCVSKVSVEHMNGVEALGCAVQGAQLRLKQPYEASIRLMAFSLVEAILQKEGAEMKILDDDQVVVDLFEAALEAAEDSEEKVAQQAKRVVLACSVPLAFALLNGRSTLVCQDFSLLQPTSNTLETIVEPRQRGFSPSQLSQVLDFIAGSAPASVLVGGEQAAKKGSDSPPDEWLFRLVQEMEVLVYDVDDHLAEEKSKSGSLQQPRGSKSSSNNSSAASLWWLVLQTAAKQCVESKLNTHWGGAAQTLSMLERAVQKLSRGNSGGAQKTSRGVDFDFASKNKNSVSMPPGARLAGICLLHFLFALEQELGAAISGSLVRCPPNKSACLYFSGNRKVCEEWLARLRSAASTGAEDFKLHHLAVYHGFRRLESLKKQSDELKTKIAEEEEKKIEDKEKKETDQVVLAGKEEKPKLGLLQRPKQLDISRSSPLKTSLEQQNKRNGVAEPAMQEKLASLEKSTLEAASLLSSSLCALHESDSLAGVYSLCTTTFPSSTSAFDWLHAAEFLASGNYEAAIESLLKSLSNEQQQSPSSASMIVGAEAYAALHDLEGLQQWLKTASPASSSSQLDGVALHHYAEMAEWGQRLSSSSSLDSVLSTKEEKENTLVEKVKNLLDSQVETLSSPSKAALQALAGIYSQSTAGSTPTQDAMVVIKSVSTQIVDFILSQSSVGEFGLLPKRALPGIAEDIGALAALQLALVPQQAAQQRLSSRRFSAWEDGQLDVSCSPAAMHVAGNLLAGVTASTATRTTTSSSSDLTESLAMLKFNAAAVAKATGNLTTSQKILASMKVNESSAGGSSSSLLASLPVAFSTPPAAPAELVHLYKQACDSDSDTSLLSKDTANHASICWQYAQYLKKNQTATEWLESLNAAAKALFLAGCSAPSLPSLNVLPIALFIHRTLIDNVESIAIHEKAVLSSLEQVPRLAWRLIIPQLISLLSTSRVPAIQRIASHMLLKEANSSGRTATTNEDPTCVLLPALVELQRETPSSSGDSSRCLHELVNTLRATNPSLCEDLFHFTHSLSSLALLEDERWHAVLLEAQGTLTKRLAASYAYLKSIRPPRDPSTARSAPPFTDAFVEAVKEEVACAVAPVLAALHCHVHAAIKAAAEKSETTPHEKQFREKMDLIPRLQWMLEHLERPVQLAISEDKQTASGGGVSGGGSSAGALEAALQRPLQVIKNIAGEVAEIGMKVTELELKNVCPGLAVLGGNSGIRTSFKLRVPQGLGSFSTVSTAATSSAIPFIESIESEVKVLHTKTRPKKITIRGTDGNTYSFLVKGREDLRVDLAVSTFFAAADVALASTASRGGAVIPLTVVPAGPQAGLVGWVERTKPLYEVYASYEAQRAQRAAWLAAATLAQTPSSSTTAASISSSSQQQQKMKNQRNSKKITEGPEMTKTQLKKIKKAEKEAAAAAAAAAQAAQAAAQAALESAKQPMRPADLYRSKIKAAGVNTSSPRSSWPLEALKSVFSDLSSTAPHNMIANELLYSAAGAAHWWSRVHHYTTSTAVMSIFGYLLGLGDRHLDNVMIQSDTGMVLHVDFGVLFDRGGKLHVPEVVPFRLTQSFIAGLGVTGVQGKFKKEMEAAMMAVRHNRTALGMLLQSMVEDSLICWAPEVGLRTSRLAFERCVELTHFIRTFGNEEKSEEENIPAALEDARSVLERLDNDLSSFCKLFSKAQSALHIFTEYQQQKEQAIRIIEDGEVEDLQLQNTLTATATEIEELQIQLNSAVQTASLLEASHPSLSSGIGIGSTSGEGVPVSSPYAGVLAAVLKGHLASALHAAASTWEPSLSTVPLGMVQSYSLPELTLVHVALGVEPSTVPLTASLLLKAATVDDAGKEVLSKEADGVRGAVAAIQQYAHAVNALNNTSSTTGGEGGSNEGGASLYYTLLTQNNSSGSSKSTTSSTLFAADNEKNAECNSILATWKSLKVHCRASTSLLTQLTSTQNSLQLERIDVALAAADAKKKLAVEVVATPPAMLATALAKFSEDAAGTMKTLTLTEAAAEVLDVFQHYLFGYSNVIHAAEQQQHQDLSNMVGSSGEISGGDGDGEGSSASSNWLVEAVPWFSTAIQGADTLNTAAGELQLLGPQLTSLLSTTNDPERLASFEDVSTAFTAIQQKLDNYSTSTTEIQVNEEEEEEDISGSIMAQLVDISTNSPAIGSFLQCLHTVQTAATSSAASLNSISGGGGDGGGEKESRYFAESVMTGPVLERVLSKKSESVHWECLELAAAAVDTWSSLVAAAAGSKSDAEIDELQKSISSIVSSSVSIAAQLHFLPAVHAAMKTTASELKEKATMLSTKKPVAAPRFNTKSAVVEQTTSLDSTTIPTSAIVAPPSGSLFDSSLFLEREKGGEMAQVGDMPLPAFFDYLDDDGGGGDDGALGGLDSLTLEEEEEQEEEEEEEEELVQQMEQLDVGVDENQPSAPGVDLSSVISTSLETCISNYYEKSGALAAVDAVLQVTSSTSHQAAQQAQQAQIDLAAHQWMYEPVLVHYFDITHEELKTALQLESARIPSASSSTALLPSPLELTLSALLIPRYEVLSNLKTAISALQSAEEEIQKWKNVAVPIENVFSSELTRIAPAASASIQMCLEAGHGWRNNAVVQGMQLIDALNALVECERARDTSAVALAVAAAAFASSKKKEEEQHDAATTTTLNVDAELQEKIKKEREEYDLAVAHVRAVHATLSTAQSSFTTQQQELETLRSQVQTATEEIFKIENLSASVLDQVSNVALPLVKATQKLPAVLQAVQDYIGTAVSAVEVLSTMQRRLARVHAAASISSSSSTSKTNSTSTSDARITLEYQISKILENLSTCVDSLRTTPTVLQTLYYSVDAARRSLLQHGGKGVAAAREQAGGVVRQCKDAMEKLQPLIDNAESNAANLSLVSPLLDDLLSLAKSEIEHLCATHQFELSQSNGVAFSSSSCGSSVHLYPPSPPPPAFSSQGILNDAQQPALSFAKSAMQQFDSKLDVVVKGRKKGFSVEKKEEEGSGNAASGGGGNDEDLTVSEYVDALIEEASSVDNLARMYEGWMPWI